MHTSDKYMNSGSKVSKIAIVATMHVAVVVALMSIKAVTPPAQPKPPITVDHIPDTPLTPPEPIAAIEPPPTVVPPIYQPNIIRDTFENTVTTTTTPPPAAPIKIEGPAVAAIIPVEPPVVQEKSNMVTLASAGDCAPPTYPPAAIRDGNSGTVGLALLIGTDGLVKDSRIQRSSGFKDLDRAAVAALKMCKFKPATTNGVPEPAWGQIAYVWTLD